MSRTVVIGDIHGREFWKDIVEKEKGAKFVFVGDYLDSFDVSPADQLHNFTQIMRFAKRTGAVTLMGNHDFHYTLYAQETYSGFNSVTSLLVTRDIEQYHKDGLLRTMHKIEDIIISHAGISQAWMDSCEINSVEEINEITHSVPGLLRFAGMDFYGDSPESGPLWIRPGSLIRNRVPGYRQIVGHTMHGKVTEIEGIWFIDTLHCNQYVAIVDGDVEICNI